VGGGTTITQDVLPYSLTSAKRETHAYGLNKIGLERRGFTREQLRALQHAYRLLLASKRNTSQALDALRAEANATEEVQYLLRFVESSERGVLK
jgi:UDP-N-acetylglucosamine acyltransferase